MASQVNSTKHTKKNIYQSFSNSSKDWRGRKTPKDILWSHHQPNTKTKDNTKKENYISIFLMNIRCKNSQENISKPKSTTHKKHHAPWSSWSHPRVTRIVQHMQINQCDTHINRGQKTHDHHNRHKKAFYKIQHPLMIQVLTKVGIEGTYLNIMKAINIYDKPTANIILNSEKLKVFPWKSETRQVYPLLSLPFNIVLEIQLQKSDKKKK